MAVGTSAGAAGLSAGADLPAQLAKSLSIPDERARQFLAALTQSATAGLEKGHGVRLPGLGSFLLKNADGMDLETPVAHDVAADVAARVEGINAETVSAWLTEFAVRAREAILRLEVIALGDLGAFLLSVRRPEIQKHEKGHKLLKAAHHELVFRSERKIGDLALGFEFDPAFLEAAKSRKPLSILIVVPAKDEFASMLEFYLRSAGWLTEIVTGVLEALEKLDRGGAYLTLLDASVKDGQQFVSALKMRRETNMIPLIMVYSDVNALVRPQDLIMMGDENIAEPFEFRALLDMVDAEVVRASEDRLLFTQVVHFQLPTDEGAIERAIDLFNRLIEGSGLSDEGQVSLASAFKEAMRNGADHGNRNKREKKIEVQYLLDRDKATVVVRDYGQGFTHTNFVKAGGTRDPVAVVRERKQKGMMGGLGIMLMVRCVDRIEYNDVGNRVTLMKFLVPRTAPTAPAAASSPVPPH